MKADASNQDEELREESPLEQSDSSETPLRYGGDASFVLQQLEVYNWGPFGGMHRAEFDPEGTAIIGPTGSGKTTLVDALMTLLVPQPRYNLASTGGHESDRTLFEYVRGVLGGDGTGGRQEVARPGRTISGICATYGHHGERVKLAGLFWTEGTGNAAEDLKRRWVFSQAFDQTFERWLRILNDDGIRDLLKMGRETAELRFFESKKSYLERIRKFFDVGENAFTLLNRAAGLKQLNSIDEIFRELVLDDKSAFDRALEVAAEFSNLAEIHAELELAKKQRDALVPVQEEYARLVRSREKTEACRLLKRIVPVWFARIGAEKWSEEIRHLQGGIAAAQLRLADIDQKTSDLQAQVDALRERYLELGGNVISELENTIAVQRQLVEERRKYAQSYRQMVTQFSLNDALTESAFRANQAQLTEHRRVAVQECEGQKTRTLEFFSQQRAAEAGLREIQTALEKVRQRPGSNIPPHYQDFRAELAAELTLRDGDLPYLAELIEVQPHEALWRGAIERAIGAERLRILVPEKHLATALRWVNHRDNRLHVRLQSAGEKEEKTAAFFADGYVKKLNFKSHPLVAAARRMLAGRDLHCVSSADELQRVEHGLTKEGMISGQRGKYEKHDQRRLDQDWMTGFDNKDQLESLEQQFLEAQEKVTHARRESQAEEKRLVHAEQQLKIIDALLELDFQTIDLPSAEADLARSSQRLDAMLDPHSDASQAKIRFEQEQQKLTESRQELGSLRVEIAVYQSKLTDAEHEFKIAQERAGEGLRKEDFDLGMKRFRLDPHLPAKRLRDEEQRIAEEIDTELSQQVARDADIEQHLVRKMEIAKRVDTGALAEVGSTIDDVPSYLLRLRILTEEALPEKRKRFLEYLNRSSDQGVTQLLASIDEEVDAIEQRIAELNQTLLKVDFRGGRYLQLQPQRMKDERLRALSIAMQKVRSAALKDDGGESHFKALQEMVTILREAGENRRLQGSKALLDPRFRLQFFVVEVDRGTGASSPPRTGSQSGSGGEKELMASHILTASLSYALCPPAAARPLYGTVILDEAFSKSSPSAASRIIEALRIFNLHPIFVTPNKEISLLKEHTRKVICVQRPGKQASLASISWERLEQIASTL